MDLGLSIFGLPVRGLTKSPHFLCTTKYSIHYVFQKVNYHLPQSFPFIFVAFARSAKQKSAKSPKDWVFRQRVTELQTNIFKKIALHFAPFMI